MHATLALRQLAQGDCLSQRTLRRRQMTQLRCLGLAEAETGPEGLCMGCEADGGGGGGATCVACFSEAEAESCAVAAGLAVSLGVGGGGMAAGVTPGTLFFWFV